MNNSNEEEAINSGDVRWDEETQKKFDQMINKIPGPLRSIARSKVSNKALSNTKNENRTAMGEKDMVDAFFSETPFGFHGPMKMDMEEFNIDYTKYGYSK